MDTISLITQVTQRRITAMATLEEVMDMTIQTYSKKPATIMCTTLQANQIMITMKPLTM